MFQALRTPLQQAQAHAQCAHFSDMLAACQQIAAAHTDDVDALLDVGELLLNFGYLSRARECFVRVQVLAPDNLRPVIDLANLARDAGDHAQSRRGYAALQQQLAIVQTARGAYAGALKNNLPQQKQ